MVGNKTLQQQVLI